MAGWARLRQEARDTLELLLLPGLAAVLPWSLAYRIFRWASRFEGLYRDRWMPALAQARQHGWVSDERIWARHARIIAMVDHADLWLVRSRSNRWLARHADRVGAWPAAGQAFIGYTFHWGCGFWALRDLAGHGLRAHPLVASLADASFEGRRVLGWYARLRNREVGKTLGTVAIDVGRDLRKVLAALRANEAVLAAIDVPPQGAASETVAFLGQTISVPRAMYRLAVERALPAVVFVCGLDFATGRRTLEVHPLGVPTEVNPLAQQVFRLLDERVRAAPDAWHFWGSFEHFLPVPAAVQAEAPPARQTADVAGGVTGPVPAHPIDVIVPVYADLTLTRRCIESLRQAPVSLPWRLVVVADCPPDPALRAYCASLASEPGVVVLENAENLGFVASVNRAMALAPEREVVLLNSDAEVAGDWLGRLWRCACAVPDAATVTPFSNDATICSYPWPGWEGGLPGGLGLAALDALFQRTHAGQWLEIPVGVGFCLLIRRDCLNQVGLFDADTFGRGYGEEVDFCLRARAAGWRHLLCADVFVHHAGGASFGSDKASLVAQAQRLIDARHPDFQDLIDAFVSADPAQPLRARIDLARIEAGGTAEAVHLLSERAAERAYLKGWLDHLRQSRPSV